MTGLEIKPDAGLWSRSVGPALRTWWDERRILVMRFAVVLLVICAVAKLGMDVPRLLSTPRRTPSRFPAITARQDAAPS
jgi:hypothetical protein